MHNKTTQQRIAKTFYVLFLTLSCSFVLYTSSHGVTGRTKKTSNAGCNCHGASASTAVAVTITGPETLSVNQTGQYIVTISGGPAVRGGIDIAASTGTLTPVSSSLKKIGDELTQNSPPVFSSGKCEFQFSYTAPSSPGAKILYTTGNSVNGNGNTAGDQWNFSPNKTIIVLPMASVTDDFSRPAHISLSQNYPNPFNPITEINFVMGEASVISLKVYTVTGAEVVTLLNNVLLQSGSHSVQFSGEGLPSGVYYYSMICPNFRETKKMVLAK